MQELCQLKGDGPAFGDAAKGIATQTKAAFTRRCTSELCKERVQVAKKVGKGKGGGKADEVEDDDEEEEEEDGEKKEEEEEELLPHAKLAKAKKARPERAWLRSPLTGLRSSGRDRACRTGGGEHAQARHGCPREGRGRQGGCSGWVRRQRSGRRQGRVGGQGQSARIWGALRAGRGS